MDQTLYESQRCDDVVEVEHVRNNHPEALRTPLKWSKELINEVNETRIQGPLGLSSGICVLSSTEGDLQLAKAMVFPCPEERGRYYKRCWTI